MQEFEEVAFKLTWILTRWIVENDELVFTGVFGALQAQARLENVFKHLLTDNVLLVHIFLDQLDEELVDLDLEKLWRLGHILRLELGDYGSEARAVDDRVLCLGVIPNELTQDDNHVVIDAHIVLKSTNPAPLQNFEQRFDSSLFPLLCNLLRKLLRVR